jgi:hypothetical protein
LKLQLEKYPNFDTLLLLLCRRALQPWCTVKSEEDSSTTLQPHHDHTWPFILHTGEVPWVFPWYQTDHQKSHIHSRNTVRWFPCPIPLFCAPSLCSAGAISTLDPSCVELPVKSLSERGEAWRAIPAAWLHLWGCSPVAQWVSQRTHKLGDWLSTPHSLSPGTICLR